MSLFQPTRFLSPKEISSFLVHDEQQLHSKYSFENYFESLVNGKLIILFDLICARKNIDTFFS